MQPTRCWLVLSAFCLLLIAFVRMQPLAGGQAARPLSLPGDEDLSFWANHDGLISLDVTGEVGFGDMGRLLMRRRANREAIGKLRDRFTFPNPDMASLETTDLLRAELRGNELVWLNVPESYIVTVGRVFNLPLTVVNRTKHAAPLEARIGGSSFTASLKPSSSSGFFLEIKESSPGSISRRLTLRSGSLELRAALPLTIRGLARLRVHLLDEDGSPTQARVYLTASDGLGYAPDGSISRFAALPAEQYFHADGSFEIELPAGDTLVEATRGLEYRLARRRVQLKAGETTDIRLRLARWVNMASEGWYSADAHIHANYTAPDHQVITPADVRLQTLAEDLNNANLMVANSGTAFIHDEKYFEGKANQLSEPSYIMYWNEEFRNSGMYGHLVLFNLKSLVRPIYTGFRDTPHWEDYPPNYTTAKAARRQGGAVSYPHPGYAPTFARANARELPVDLALGQIDAMDVLSNNPEEVAMKLWYRLLNCGFRLAISAGTDSFTNVADHYTPGGGRVYVHAGGPMNYDKWIAAYKRGRSFASNGPVITFTLNGAEPGDELSFPAGVAKKLRVKATVRTQAPLDTVAVIVNGKPVINRVVTGAGVVTIDEEIELDSSAWVAVRALGRWHRLILNDTSAFAHTSPVYVKFGDRPVRRAEDIRFYIDWINQLIERIEKRGRFATPEHRLEVAGLFRQARDIYRGMLR